MKNESIYKNGDIYSNCVFRIDESFSYFLDNVHRISDPKYIPTTQDVLMCRIQTTGIVEQAFYFRDTEFRIVDIGGQR